MAERPEPRPIPELVIPVLAPSGRDAEVTRQMLAEAGLQSERCASVDEIVAHIDRRCGPIVIAREALSSSSEGRLVSALEGQPGWSSVPVIIIASRSRSRSVIESRADVSVLLSPVSKVTFLGVIRSAVEARQRQFQVRGLLAEQRRLNRRLELRATQLQRLVSELGEAEDRERRRIARILHDDLQQLLVGARFLLGAVRDAQDPPRELVKEKLGRLDALIAQAMESSRSLSHTLSPPREGGFVPALEWIRERMLEMHGLRVEIDAARDAEPEDEDITSFLTRAVQELLFNAAKHARTEQADLAARRRRGYVEVTVSDRGKGFDPSTLEESHGAGVGFGLFSIAERVNLLGGRLDLQSEPGKGSTIRLLVPVRPARKVGGGETAAPDVGMTALQELRPASPSTPGDVRVVIVDDHAIARRLVRGLLESWEGIEIVGEASDGITAIRLTDRLRPDVVVMDVSMPEMDGLEASRRIKASHPGIRIVALTMFDEPAFSARMKQAGADAFISKAGPGKNLIDAVRGRADFPDPEPPTMPVTG